MKTTARWVTIWTTVALVLGAHAALAAELNLDISESQKDQLKALASNTRDRTSREREALRQARIELMKTYSTDKLDWRRLRATWEKISSAQLSLLNIHLDNEVAIRNILKEEQFKALRSMMKKRMRDREVHFVAPPETDILDRLPDERMLEALGVPEDKRKQLRPDPAHKKTIEALKEHTKDLLKLYSNYQLDSGDARKLIASIHQKQAMLLQQQHRRQRLIRSILTEEQFEKLQQQIRQRAAERYTKSSPKRKAPR